MIKDLSERDREPYIPYSKHGKKYTIYALVNLENQRRYIGRTRDLPSRLEAHQYRLKSHTHPNRHINSDSGCRFGFEVLEKDVPFEQRTEKERSYIIQYKTYDPRFGYNVNDPCIRAIKAQLIEEQL